MKIKFDKSEFNRGGFTVPFSFVDKQGIPVSGTIFENRTPCFWYNIMIDGIEVHTV